MATPMPRTETSLIKFVESHSRLFVLTGAGVSTDSGIPGYRDKNGLWKASTPIQGPEFIRSKLVQKRYWARSLIGWRHFSSAAPNAAHKALATLEACGFVQHLVTQNVDGLHQRAGSQSVTDLHGRLDTVVCLDCGHSINRQSLQLKLETLNPDFSNVDAEILSDGDAGVEGVDFSAFKLVTCDQCGGAIKPNVVFFGENVPKYRVEHAMQQLTKSDAMLIAGSSLMVYSGYRFCLKAQEIGIPIVAINQGKTRADHLLSYKSSSNTGDTLNTVLDLYRQRSD